MGESPDERITNLKFIINQYSNTDQQYIANKLSDIINSNYTGVNFDLSYRDLNTNTSLKSYLKDEVYQNILRVISDLKEYRALETALYKNQQTHLHNTPSLAPSISKSKTKSNSNSFNASFNSAFSDQLTKNKLQKMMDEEKKLAYLIDNEDNSNDPDLKPIKLFHTLTVSEIIDNLANSIVTLFQQIYTLDYVGIMNAQENYIYYGFIFIFSYVVLNMFWIQLQD
jgi:hypothetical protein